MKMNSGSTAGHVLKAGRVLAIAFVAITPILAQTLPKGWVHVTSKEGQFSIDMPGTPKEMTHTEDDGSTSHCLVYNKRTTASACFLDWRGTEDANDMIDTLIQGFAGVARVNWVEGLRLGGYNAKRFVATPREGFGKIQGVIVRTGRRFYMLAYRNLDSLDEMAEAPGLFSSFRFSDSGQVCGFNYNIVNFEAFCKPARAPVIR